MKVNPFFTDSCEQKKCDQINHRQLNDFHRFVDNVEIDEYDFKSVSQGGRHLRVIPSIVARAFFTPGTPRLNSESINYFSHSYSQSPRRISAKAEQSPQKDTIEILRKLLTPRQQKIATITPERFRNAPKRNKSSSNSSSSSGSSSSDSEKDANSNQATPKAIRNIRASLNVKVAPKSRRGSPQIPKIELSGGSAVRRKVRGSTIFSNITNLDKSASKY